MGDLKNTAKKMSTHRHLSHRVRKQHAATIVLMGIAVASLAGMMMPVPCADAAFTPNSRSELQGNGGSTLGVFGCVGSCGGSLDDNGYTYCFFSRNGPWEDGTGNPCTNANTDVPSGQGTGKYGIIGSWDVSKINDMRMSKCICN